MFLKKIKLNNTIFERFECMVCANGSKWRVKALKSAQQ